MPTTEHKMAVPKPHVLYHACVNPVSEVTRIMSNRLVT